MNKSRCKSDHFCVYSPCDLKTQMSSLQREKEKEARVVGRLRIGHIAAKGFHTKQH